MAQSFSIKRLLLILYVLVGWLAVVPAQPYCDVRTFNSRDGLAANIISGMTQDENGLMWFSTWNGLCCYDGYRFTTFRGSQSAGGLLSSNRLLMVRAASEGHLWCITYDRRVYVFDSHSCRFVDFSQLVEQQLGLTFVARNIYPLSNGFTWVADQHGEVCFRVDDRRLLDGWQTQSGEGIECYRRGDSRLKGAVKKVVLDDAGREWIVCQDGVSLQGGRFDSREVFEHIQSVGRSVFFATPQGRLARLQPGHAAPQPVKLPPSVSAIHSLCRVDKRRLAVATNDGLLLVDANTLGVSQVSVRNPAQPSPVVQRVFADSLHRLWAFGQAAGVTLVSTDGSNVRWLASPSVPALQQTTSSEPFFHVDAAGTPWLVPTGGTFCYYDEPSHALVPFVIRSVANASASIPLIEKTFADRQHNLWFTGIHDLTLLNFRYRHFHFLAQVPNQEVRSVCTDSQGRLWTGNSLGTVGLYAASGSQPAGYLNRQGQLQPAACQFSTKVYALFCDSRQRLWIGTKGDGLYLRHADGRMEHFVHQQGDNYSLSDNEVYAIDEDRHHRLWIGTYNGGINLVDEREGQTLRFVHQSNDLTTYPRDQFNKVRRITHTPQGVMMVSTNSGLLTFSDTFASPQAIRFFISKRDGNDSLSLQSSDVMQTLVTRSGRIFVATMGGGFQQLVSSQLLADNLQLRSVAAFQQSDGIIQSMVEDNRGIVWVIRESSICAYNPADSTLLQYGPNDLGERMEFSETLPSHNAATDQIAVGTMGGVLVFTPRDIVKSNYKPQIVFTSVQYQGNRQSQPLLNADELKLTADQRNLTISFAALDYSDNYLIRYAYMIEGVDHEWNYVEHGHSASFNHLPAGHYRLLVKSTNSDGVWVDNTRALLIHAAPTFWETVWAKLLYLLLMAAIVAVAIYVYRLRSKAAMERQLNDMKTQFFTDISHRLRTPLTLIGGPVSEVLTTERLSEAARSHLEMVQRNSRRMLGLVNRMLDYSKTHNYFVDDDNAQVFVGDEPARQQGESAEPQGTGLKLLIVEDNTDLRLFLMSILQGSYVVLDAENGQEGLEIAEREIPDFIITDVNMPVMDGLTMVHHIKQNKDICHIPIIVLSAKASLDDKLQGLREGIDDYITKPFSATYLKQRVENIIAQRHALQQNYLENLTPMTAESKTLALKVQESQLEDADKQMMERLMAYLDEHIADSNLKIEDLAAAVNLGRTVFYGKIKTMVGLSPVDFLRRLRIQKAEQLVAKSTLSFSEIAYEVGFADPKYFGRIFKKETGMTPSEYRNNSSSAG